MNDKKNSMTFPAALRWVLETPLEFHYDSSEGGWLKITEGILDSLGIDLEEISYESRWDDVRGDLYLAQGHDMDMLLEVLRNEITLLQATLMGNCDPDPLKLNIQFVYDGPVSKVRGMENYTVWPVEQEKNQSDE